MTVSSELNRKEYAGDGVTTAFATSPVVFFDSADLKVYVVTTATGAATLQTITTHYTVSGGSGSTGTVTMLTAPTAAQTLVIVRDVAATQSSDFVNNDINDAETLEDALDRLTMLAQQNEAAISRSLRLADSDVTGADPELPTPVANKLIGWDSAGTALENYSGADIAITAVSAFMETVLDDTTAAIARTTLGAVGLTGDETVAGAKTFSIAIIPPEGTAGTPGIRVGSSSTTGFYSAGDNTVRVASSGAEVARFLASGISVIGGSVLFPATQAASADANALDDYEEGTWTPDFTFATAGDLAKTFSTQLGSYTKIGRLVHLVFDLATSAFTYTTASGSVSISTSPFTSMASPANTPRGPLAWDGITKANYTDAHVAMASSSTSLLVQMSGSAQTLSSVSAVDMPTGGSVSLRGSVIFSV
jgi:hypothetical protein